MISIQSLSPRQYHSLPFDKSKLPSVAVAGHISASMLWKARKPLYFFTDDEVKSTSSMQWGSLVDCLFTTPELFRKEYCILPSDAPPDKRRFKDAKKPSEDTLSAIRWWDDFEASNAGKEVVSQATYQMAKMAVAVLKEHPLSAEIANRSIKQACFVGTFENSRWGIEDGIKAKALLDFLVDNGDGTHTVADLKTTEDVSSPNKLYSVASHWGYPFKMAYYQIMAMEAGYTITDDVKIIWQSRSMPYEVKVRRISEDYMVKMRAKVLDTIQSLSYLDSSRLSDYYDLDCQDMIFA